MIQGTGITGGSFPAEIWGRYMRAWHEGLEERDYEDPEPSTRSLEVPPARPPGRPAGGGSRPVVVVVLVGSGGPTTTVAPSRRRPRRTEDADPAEHRATLDERAAGNRPVTCQDGRA